MHVTNTLSLCKHKIVNTSVLKRVSFQPDIPPSEMTRVDVFTSSSAHEVIGFKSMSKRDNSKRCLRGQKQQKIYN